MNVLTVIVIRVSDMAERMRERRDNETETEYEQRLQNQLERTTQSRDDETTAERTSRLQADSYRRRRRQQRTYFNVRLCACKFYCIYFVKVLLRTVLH